MTTLQRYTGIVCLLFISCCVTKVSAQGGTSVHRPLKAPAPDLLQPLSIGDKVPEVILKNLHNYKAATAKISDFRGKLLILDFWATWCSSCIAGMSKMEKLQKQYPDQLKVILINSSAGKDTEEGVKAFFGKRKQQSGSDFLLTNMLENKELGALFPRSSIPHYVWIDKTGNVVAITLLREVTAENLRRVMEGKPVTMSMKLDQVDFDAKTPLLVNENGGNEADFLFRSILTGYNNRINGRIGNNGFPKQAPNKIYFLNKPISDILRLGYETLTENKNRWVFASTDSSRLKEKVLNPDNKYEYMYCYELITPPSPIEAIRRSAREDLKRYFNISAYQEKRTLNCLTITKAPQHMPSLVDTVKVIRFQSIASLVEFLNAVQSLPFADLTGSQLAAELVIPQDIIQYPDKLRSYLVDAGFSITDILQEYNVSVITDK